MIRTSTRVDSLGKPMRGRSKADVAERAKLHKIGTTAATRSARRTDALPIAAMFYADTGSLVSGSDRCHTGRLLDAIAPARESERAHSALETCPVPASHSA
jgi:hypothetical protein